MPNYPTIALISHASKAMFKILQARLQQYVNAELPDVQAGFWKGRGTRDQIANICWIMEKARDFQKSICFCFTDYAKAFDCVDHNQLVEITATEQNMEKRMKRNEDNITDLLDNIKCTNIFIIIVPEEERQKGSEKIFEEIIDENFPNMRKEIVN